MVFEMKSVQLFSPCIPAHTVWGLCWCISFRGEGPKNPTWGKIATSGMHLETAGKLQHAVGRGIKESHGMLVWAQVGLQVANDVSKNQGDQCWQWWVTLFHARLGQ